MDALATARELADAAHDAWRRIADEEGLGETVGMGADGTETTRADAELDRALLARAADLGITVLSEEAGFVDHGSEMVAVVDPLDGSRNAGRGIPFHCTSIAIGRDDLLGLEAGVVRDLTIGTEFSARRGHGALVDGEPVARRPFDGDEVMVAVIADSSLDEMKQEQERRGHHLRDLGSAALELCLVGTGALDAFLVRQAWLRVIDVAAGALFVREAGGIVMDPFTGRDLATPFTLEARCGLVAAHGPEAMEAVS